MSRALRRALDAEIERHPGVTATHENRGKHRAVRLFVGDHERLLFYAATTSDCRAIKNEIARVRRTIRELNS